jgi:hypothetical protein
VRQLSRMQPYRLICAMSQFSIFNMFMNVWTGLQVLYIQMTAINATYKNSCPCNLCRSSTRVQQGIRCGSPTSSNPGCHWSVCICKAAILPVCFSSQSCTSKEVIPECKVCSQRRY